MFATGISNDGDGVSALILSRQLVISCLYATTCLSAAAGIAPVFHENHPARAACLVSTEALVGLRKE